MSSEQFSLRIPKGTKEKLEELAKATGRTKAFLAIEAIEKGIKDIDNGKHVSIDDVKKEWGIE